MCAAAGVAADAAKAGRLVFWGRSGLAANITPHLLMGYELGPALPAFCQKSPCCCRGRFLTGASRVAAGLGEAGDKTNPAVAMVPSESGTTLASIEATG